MGMAFRVFNPGRGSSPTAAGPVFSTGSHPVYRDGAAPLSARADHFTRHEAANFRTLISHYAPQRTNSSCSLATASMIVNAALSRTAEGGAFEPVTQEDMLRRSGGDFWRRRTADEGDGLTLDEFAGLLLSALSVSGFLDASVEAVHVADGSPETVAAFRRALEKCESSPREFLALNFLQGLFVGDERTGHFAAVGVHAGEDDAVAVIDPDETTGGAYWVPVAALVRGLATFDADAGKPRGYARISF